MRVRVLAVVVLAAAGPPAAAAAPLPHGDGRVTTTNPRPGWALACAKPDTRKPSRPPWMSGRTYDPADRPVVDGSIGWPEAAFSLSRGSASTAFAGNGEPVSAPTGAFPPGVGDDAQPYAGDAAPLAPHAVTGRFRRTPAVRGAPYCLASDEPVAVALNGVPVLPAFTSAGLDAVAREVVDRCAGRTDAAGLYHYRASLNCLLRGASPHRHSPLIGWARDGFGLYGPRGAGGKRLRNGDLDACHGHVHPGPGRHVYHYHLTAEYPYAIGCFRGRPSTSWTMVGSPAPPGPPPPPEPEPDLSKLRIAATPSLYPSFDLDVPDYVTRCDGTDPVQVDVDAPEHALVSVDGAAPSGGAFGRAVGIEPNEGFAVEVRTPTTSRLYHVRCLPSDFPTWETERSGDPQAEWYAITMIATPYAAIFDSFGVPVWWMAASPQPIDASITPRGNVLWGRNVGVESGNPGGYEEHRLDGSLVREYHFSGATTDFHDLQWLANGNRLMLSYRPRDHVDLSAHGGPDDATVLDAVVQELEPDDDVAWEWSSEGHIPLSDTERWWSNVLASPATLPDGRKAYDPWHINSVEQDGDGMVISLRHTDAVYRIDRDTGAIDWKLGGTATTERLTILGDSLADADFGGQHDARILGDGTLTLHDNGTRRSRPIRLLRYRIDPVARTATLLESITDPDVPTSGCCGGARRLAGGDWVAAWGSTRFLGEIDGHGNNVLRIQLGTGFSYRAHPILPGVLSRSALRAGMDAMHPR